MLQFHQQYPPARKCWIINTGLTGQITHTMVKWLGQLCGTLEMIQVVRKRPTDPGMLPHLLMAAVAATKLHYLKLSGTTIKSAELCSLAFLRQLQCILLEDCYVTLEDGLQMHSIHGLTALQSLQVSPHP